MAFHDNWMPTVPARPPERIPISEPWSPFTPVAVFIDHGSWDIQLLTRVFSPVDVASISTIPLPIEPIPDQFVWQFSDSGAYTVHSGYEIAHHGLVEIPEMGPTSPMDADAWNKLWSFPVPPKLHFFIWKCVLGVLPTRTALNVDDHVLKLVRSLSSYTKMSYTMLEDLHNPLVNLVALAMKTQVQAQTIKEKIDGCNRKKNEGVMIILSSDDDTPSAAEGLTKNQSETTTLFPDEILTAVASKVTIQQVGSLGDISWYLPNEFQDSKSEHRTALAVECAKEITKELCCAIPDYVRQLNRITNRVMVL
ncbi:hypothetical protein LINPERHAP2_LOCUS9271 [Linum perenne]